MAEQNIPERQARYDEVKGAVWNALNDALAQGDHHTFRAVGDVLRDAASAFHEKARSLEITSFGGDGDFLTCRTVALALDGIATQVEENGQAEVPD
jgi:hypothetical protein